MTLYHSAFGTSSLANPLVPRRTLSLNSALGYRLACRRAVVEQPLLRPSPVSGTERYLADLRQGLRVDA